MPVRFDPYHKWLGIPHEEQPPHHYRLLGVQPFESDPDVISNAADQRMGLLKTFATSNNGSLAEDLLDEVARARVCLLNPAKKGAYDSTLRDRLGIASAQSQVPEGFWLPPLNGMADALDVTCPHCEATVAYDLAPSPQLLQCKACSKQMSLPSREEVVRAAALLTQKSVPSGSHLLAKDSSESISSQERPDTREAAPQFDTSNTRATQVNWPVIDSMAAPSFMDLRFAPRRRKRARRSPLVFLISVLLGGLAGLSAGYLVLCHIDLRYDFFHLMSAENHNTRRQVTSENSITPPRPSIPEVQRPAKPRLPQRDPNRVPRIKPQPQNQGAPHVSKPNPLPAQPVPKPGVPIANLPVMLDKPSAIVTLNLDKPVIHIIAESDKANDVLCDVGFSHNLLHRGDARNGYELVANGLVHRKKETVELGANINGEGAAIEITVTRQNNVVRCDLRPLFSLPSGDIEPLTITRGTTLYNKLNKSLAAARAARDSLPAMRSNLSQLQSALRTAQQAMSANGNSPAETGAGRTAAITQATNLNQQINALSKNVTAAEKLSKQEPAISKDLQALNEIAEYAKAIASVSTVSVRFHVGDATIPATAK